MAVDVHDPYASSEEVKEEYGFKLIKKIRDKYDAVVLAVNHEEYLHHGQAYFKNLLNEKGIFVDVKGVMRNKINGTITYWSL